MRQSFSAGVSLLINSGTFDTMIKANRHNSHQESGLIKDVWVLIQISSRWEKTAVLLGFIKAIWGRAAP